MGVLLWRPQTPRMVAMQGRIHEDPGLPAVANISLQSHCLGQCRMLPRRTLSGVKRRAVMQGLCQWC
jgi:hypothetical protein